MLLKYPWRTQIASAMGLWFTGDQVAQRLEGNKQIDWNRSCRMTAFGLCFAGPLYAWWYPFLERRTAHLLSGSQRKYIFTKVPFPVTNSTNIITPSAHFFKVLCDQTIFEIPFLTLFFTSTTIMEAGFRQPDLQGVIKEEVKTKLPTTYALDCCLWPAAQVLNFTRVPVMYQSLFVNTLCTLWNSVLSFAKHLSVESEPTDVKH
jgi:protein Mpv17